MSTAAAFVAFASSRGGLHYLSPDEAEAYFSKRHMVLANRGLQMWFKYNFLSPQTAFVHEHDLPEAGATALARDPNGVA